MRYYPLFIDLTHWHCLVIGAGNVGRRKISTLLSCHVGHLLVLDEHLEEAPFFDLLQKECEQNAECKNDADLISMSKIQYCKRSFHEKDLDAIRLVFAATSDSVQNGIIAELCKEKQILCNVIENPHRGDCIVPSHVLCEDLIIALSTSGSSPALAKALKKDLNEWLDQGYAPFLKFMDYIRKLFMQERFIHIDRTMYFRILVQSPVREDIMTCLVQGKKAKLFNILKNILPNEVFDVFQLNELSE